MKARLRLNSYEFGGYSWVWWLTWSWKAKGTIAWCAARRFTVFPV